MQFIEVFPLGNKSGFQIYVRIKSTYCCVRSDLNIVTATDAYPRATMRGGIKGLIEAHGRKISVTSVPGKTTTFNIELPMRIKKEVKD